MRSSRILAGTLPAASQMHAAPDPRARTGWSGASPHVLRYPRGLSSGFPFARRALPLRPPSPVSLRPAFSGSSLRPLPGSGFPSVSLRFPSLSNLHVSAAAGRFRRRRSRAAGTKVTSPAATLPRPGNKKIPYAVLAAAGCQGTFGSRGRRHKDARSGWRRGPFGPGQAAGDKGRLAGPGVPGRCF
jgi:hypothetical protein